jgi:hypothetical protein
MDLSLKAVFEELIGRLSTGPLRFRLVMQPAMAALLGVRAGFADARDGMPPFVSGLIFRRSARHGDLKTAFRHLMIPILIATILDALVQYVMFGHIRPVSALTVGTLLMSFPYCAARGLSNRIKSRRRARQQRTQQGAQTVPHNLDPHS